jgi:hypothetical protein
MALRKITLTCGALGLLCAIAFATNHDDVAPAARAAGIVTPRVPRAALLVTHPGAELTSLFFVDVRDGSALAPVTTFGHLPDATVRAAIVPGKTDVLATADVTPTHDVSFNAALFHLRPHTPPERLVDRVVHASRPLVTSAGRVFVSRGEPGKEVEGQMRVDALTIDEVDLTTGQTRSLHQMQGYLLFLAGSFGDEIIVYRIQPGHADIVAIQADTGKERFVIADLPPYARDFSIDLQHNALVFQNRHETDSQTWTIERVDLKTGKRQRLYSSPSMTLAPFALPRGGVLFNPPGHGLMPLDAQISIAGPLGAGVDVVTASTADGQYLAALHTQPSSFSVPFVVDTKSGAARVLPAPPNTRIALAGFVEEGGAP